MYSSGQFFRSQAWRVATRSARTCSGSKGSTASRAGLGFGRVVADLGHLDLLEVFFGLELVELLVPDHRVGGMGDRDVFVDVDAKAGIVDGLGHPHKGFDHHVHGEMLPLE